MSDSTGSTSSENGTDRGKINRPERAETEPPPPQEVYRRLETIVDPQLDDDLVSLGLIQRVRIDADSIFVWIGLYAPHAPSERQILEDVHDALSAYDREVVTFAATEGSKATPENPIPGVRNVVPIVGVGPESGAATVAYEVACSLNRRGARVGYLDLGLERRPDRPNTTSSVPRDAIAGDSAEPIGGEPIIPSTIDGVRAVCPETHQRTSDRMRSSDRTPGETVERLTSGVDWGEIDYLVGGLPAGSGLESAFLERAEPASAVVVAPRSASPHTVEELIEELRANDIEPAGVVTTRRGSVRGQLRERFELDPTSWVAEELPYPLLGELSIDQEADSPDGEPVIGRDDETLDAIAAGIADRIGAIKRRRHSQRVDGTGTDRS